MEALILKAKAYTTTQKNITIATQDNGRSVN